MVSNQVVNSNKPIDQLNDEINSRNKGFVQFVQKGLLNKTIQTSNNTLLNKIILNN